MGVDVGEGKFESSRLGGGGLGLSGLLGSGLLRKREVHKFEFCIWIE